MPFIGNQPALSYTSFAKQDFTTSATTSYTLDNPVANANELALFINFVRQEPTTAYSASGTTLTLTEATSASDDMYCVYLGKAVQTVNPPNASVGTSQLVDGAVTSAKLSSGKILQVVQATKQDTQDFALATGTLSDVTGLSASITPSSSSNKILVMFTVHIGQNSSGSANAYININRGGSDIFIGDASGSRTRGTSSVGMDMNSQYTLKIATQTFLDSPSTTSATTYKLRAGGFNGRTFHINRTIVDAAEGNTATSTLTLMEVSA